jgi:hypothetical protein
MSSFFLQCMSPVLALSGHANGAEQCLLSGGKRTWLKAGLMSAHDPKRTSLGDGWQASVPQLRFVLKATLVGSSHFVMLEYADQETGDGSQDRRDW